MGVPEPLISIAIEPKTAADREKLAGGLARLMAEDAAFRVTADPLTSEVVVGAMSELHLEIILDRLKREFDVEASVGRPQIAYKETVTRAAEGEMKYAAQIGGRGQYGHVKIRLYPGEPGAGCRVEHGFIRGVIPDAFVEPIHDGIKEALSRGVLADYPVADVRIEVYDGSYHDVDSSAMAFRIAAERAFHDAAAKAGPVLLEPVMRVEVIAPTDYVGDIVANLSSRRGRVQSREDRGGAQVISARVPLPEMFGYASDLRSRTMGRGTFSMSFDRYQPCPPAEEDDGGRPSPVRVPPRPGPRRDGRVALPEPDDRWRTDGSD